MVPSLILNLTRFSGLVALGQLPSHKARGNCYSWWNTLATTVSWMLTLRCWGHDCPLLVDFCIVSSPHKPRARSSRRSEVDKKESHSVPNRATCSDLAITEQSVLRKSLVWSVWQRLWWKCHAMTYYWLPALHLWVCRTHGPPSSTNWPWKVEINSL